MTPARQAPTPRRQVIDDEAGRIQERLWRTAVAAAEADPRSVPAGLFTQAMNELIDLKGERDAALARGVVGYENGCAGARTLGVTTLLCALTALVILVIVDLDRPRRGLIRVS